MSKVSLQETFAEFALKLPEQGGEITIIFPKQADGELVELTSFLVEKLGLEGGYGLGGENGYGAEYENDTFMMRPYCWCDQEDCLWCCGDAPNFLYKPTGGKVWWYKWIGRSERIEGEFDKDWLDKCKKSVEDTNGTK